MTSKTHRLDINLFVHDGATTIAAAIESVLAQTFQDWRLTLIDDGSTDGTLHILEAAVRMDPRVQLVRNRVNTGMVGAFQRGLWLGDADLVLPKSADDLIAPEFCERLVALLDSHPDCVMAHAAGLSFHDGGRVDFVYPPSHRLHAVGPDPLARARAIMLSYTSAPSFWGIYRRAALNRLRPLAYRPGFDHVILAELALYGEIRHDPGVMLWRRGTGRPVGALARASMAETPRGLPLEHPWSDALWRAPYLATAFAHIENFLLAPAAIAPREALLALVRECFQLRWGPLLAQEAAGLRRHVAEARAWAMACPPDARALALLPIARAEAALAVLTAPDPLAALDAAPAAAKDAPPRVLSPAAMAAEGAACPA